MNTDIIKGRAKSTVELYDNFNQPLHLYDGVLVDDCGMRLDLIIGINEDKSIKLFNCSGKKYKHSLILANNIVGEQAIRKLRDKYFSTQAAIEKAKEERITKKVIFGMWKNKVTKRFGVCNIVISSRPGKSVLKSEIKNKINEIKDFCNKNPQYKFSFFTKMGISSSIDEAYVFPDGEVLRNVFQFANSEDGFYNYIENPKTGKDELKDISKDSFFLTIYDVGSNLIKTEALSKYLISTGFNSQSYAMTTTHTVYGFYSKNSQKIYYNFYQNSLMYGPILTAFKAFTKII